MFGDNDEKRLAVFRQREQDIRQRAAQLGQPAMPTDSHNLFWNEAVQRGLATRADYNEASRLWGFSFGGLD